MPNAVTITNLAVKWDYDNIHRYGGTTAKLFVAGHSAGGWLTTMLSLNKDYLKKWHIDSDSIAGWFSISGQMVTHSTVRSEVGMDGVIPFLDEYAPCLNIRKMNSLLVLITGDRAMELSSRYEENLYFYSLMKNLGNKNIEIHELHGFDHGNVYKPACLLILEKVEKMIK